MRGRNFAFIDLETTGLEPARHEILEIACLVAKPEAVPGRGPKLSVVDEFEVRVKPEHLERADPEALRINGYNDADWLFAADLRLGLEPLVAKTENAVMVGQNVSFDWAFLERAAETTGLQFKMHYHRIDLLSMAFARLYHNLEIDKLSLRALAEYFKIENPRAHTALADIRVTYQIFCRLLEI